MARGNQIYIELFGPLFDVDALQRVQDAIAKGIEIQGERSAAIMQAITYAKGFEDTGAFARSVDSDYRRKPNTTGYAKVAPTNVWEPGKPGRPTRTWAERGVRSGKKLRKGLGIFRNSATMSRKAIDHDMFARLIAEALQ